MRVEADAVVEPSQEHRDRYHGWDADVVNSFTLLVGCSQHGLSASR